MSGDIEFSYKLFTEIKTELDRVSIKGEFENPLVGGIYRRNQARLIDTIDFRIRVLYTQYADTRDLDYLLQTKPLLQELFAIDRNHYAGHLMQSIILFKVGDLLGAINELKDIRNDDPTWRYNLGFLCAYNNQIDEAYDQYRRAQYGYPSANVLNDTEVFLSEQIEENPDKTQLVFFRGYVSYKCKEDYKSAKSDFEAFVSDNNSNNHPFLKDQANKYLEELVKYVGV